MAVAKVFYLVFPNEADLKLGTVKIVKINFHYSST